MTTPTSAPLRVLSLSTLFPCPQRPAFGGFVANQMKMVAALAQTGNAGNAGNAETSVDMVMINPIGLPPWPLRAYAPYRKLAACPATSELGGLIVHHPRFCLIPKIGAGGNPARIARAVLPLARRLHAQRPFDLVDAQFYFPDGPAAAHIAKALGVPFTIKARGADIQYWATRADAGPQIRAAGAGARLQLTVSQALGRDMVAAGLPADSVRVHYTGLDRARFHLRPRSQARAALPGLLGITPPDGAPLLIAPGALIPRKGHAIALEALALLPGAHLVLVGAGPEAARLHDRASRSDLAGRVEHLGQVSHDLLPILMAACDALVLPSASEGLANVWVEALACGTPLVITDAGGAREVVKTAAAGRITTREPATIAAALRDILATPPTQEDVAANVAGFSWEENARQLVALWHEAAART